MDTINKVIPIVIICFIVGVGSSILSYSKGVADGKNELVLEIRKELIEKGFGEMVIKDPVTGETEFRMFTYEKKKTQ